MKIKTPLAVIALMLVPTLVTAQGCRGDHQEASMSCADGAIWNPETKSCETSSS